MSTSSWRRTVTLRDGVRVTLRPIAPEDKPLIAASFERLSEESRYRRFFTSKKELSAADLDYLVDVDHSDHEAIIAVDPLSGEAVGVARYVRSNDDAEVAELAVTVIDDWQGRGLGRVLLTRLTDRAGREGVRRFSAVVLGQNREALRLFNSLGDVRREYDAGMVELVIELPPEGGIGARLARALREAAAGNLFVALARGAGDAKIGEVDAETTEGSGGKTQRSS
jgi:GNAT superfamily N-acetyltransferase